MPTLTKGNVIVEEMKTMELTKRQADFLELVKEGKNVFLTGNAGTGKSYVVKEAIKTLKEKGTKYVALAPTGIAANNIGGQTIHSMFGLDPFGIMSYESCRFLNSSKRKVLQKVETFFIDEVSMLRPDILDAMNWTLTKNGLKGLKERQIIFIGDLKQLPVVLNDNSRDILYRDYNGETFQSAKVFEKGVLTVETIELDEIVRQSDPEFIENLNLIRNGEAKVPYFRKFITDKPNNGVVLAAHNSTVERYNIDGLAAINSEEIVFTAKIKGTIKPEDFNLESEIKLKQGCKIMYLVNSQNNPLRNGTLGKFITIDGLHYINVDGIDYKLDAYKFSKKEYVLNDKTQELELTDLGSIEQIPVKLAYALSIHKSQGLTFNEVTVDLTRPCFANGQMYVALSRVTNPDGLAIIV